MTAVIARIALRYLAGVLVARGLLGADDAAFLISDPDMQMLAGACIGGAAELWWLLARRFGWER